MASPFAAPRSFLVAALIAAACLLCAAAAPAAAGTYDVWSCKTPSGTPTSTAGWAPVSSLLYDQPGDECALGGRLSAKFTALGGPVSGGLSSGWQFTAPVGTKVAAARLQWAVATRPAAGDTQATARVAAYRGSDPHLPTARLLHCDAGGEGCEQGAAAQVELPVDAESFGFSAGCAGPVGESTCARGEGSRAKAALAAARLTLVDDTLPTGNVTGAPLSGRPLRGTAQLRVQANDIGAGVWQAEVRIGAKVVAKRRTLDANGGRCAPLPGSSAFGHPEPCPSTAAATLRFSTKGATDGSQLLTVTVWDAANNPAVLVSKMVSVDNARRIKADGTIMMPALENQAEDQLFAAAGAGAADGLRPPTLGSDPALMNIISAMNALADARIPYCYGGGHGTTPAVPSAGQYCWQGNPAQKLVGSGAVGLDCSSSLSWVLQQAGYPIQTITSGLFAGAGEAGEGEQMTIWANPEHVYAEVKVGGKSYYWGTSRENPEHGPGWHRPRSSAPFTARHLPGL